MHNLNKVFVYGTLKVGGYYAENFDRVRVSSRRATLKGEMFSFINFPGISLDGDNTIIGEIHEYDEITSVMKVLDKIEGCSGKVGKKDDLYNREVTQVTTSTGKEHAWVYTINVKNRDMLASSDIVESGEWIID